jgi:hypothetical protein
LCGDVTLDISVSGVPLTVEVFEMDKQKELKVEKVEGQRRGGMVGGLILIAVGVLALIGQFVDIGEMMGWLVLGGLSLIFIVAGIATRQSGFFIPGGILAGLALGVMLMVSPLRLAGIQDEGGVFLLAFAAGWVLIPVLSIIFSRGERHLWALIVAVILALVGAGVTFGGAALATLELLGKIWPIFLIAGGILILLKRGPRTE